MQLLGSTLRPRVSRRRDSAAGVVGADWQRLEGGERDGGRRTGAPRAPPKNYLSLCVYAGRHGQQTLIGSLYISRPASLGSLEHPPVCVVCGAYGGAWDTHTHPCIGSRRARPPTCRRSVWCARALVAVSSGIVTGACACLGNLMDPLLYNQSSGGERATSGLSAFKFWI